MVYPLADPIAGGLLDARNKRGVIHDAVEHLAARVVAVRVVHGVIFVYSVVVVGVGVSRRFLSARLYQPGLLSSEQRSASDSHAQWR